MRLSLDSSNMLAHLEEQVLTPTVIGSRYESSVGLPPYSCYVPPPASMLLSCYFRPHQLSALNSDTHCLSCGVSSPILCTIRVQQGVSLPSSSCPHAAPAADHWCREFPYIVALCRSSLTLWHCAGVPLHCGIVQEFPYTVALCRSSFTLWHCAGVPLHCGIVQEFLYVVELQYRGASWTVHRALSEFHALLATLVLHLPVLHCCWLGICCIFRSSRSTV